MSEIDRWFVSDCEGRLQVWREAVLRGVTRDENGEITGYRVPVAYKDGDLIASWDLHTWDEGEDGGDDERRAIAAWIVRDHNEVEQLRAELAEREWADMFTHQECQNKQHADWWVDSEHNHLCPWCAIAEAEDERDRLAEQLRKAAAYLFRRADLDADLSPSESRALAAELRDAALDETEGS